MVQPPGGEQQRRRRLPVDPRAAWPSAASDSTPPAQRQVNPPVSSSAACSRVVLPMPASPETTSAPATPPWAAASRTRTRPSSSSRPTSPAVALGDFPDATARPLVRPSAQEEPPGGGPDGDIDQDPREDRRPLRLGRLDVRRPGVPAPALVSPPAEGGPLLDTAALVDRMVDCFNRHDPEALAACYAPDARVHPAGWPQAVDTGTWLAAVPVI
jgi:hypothetical protein